VEFSADTYCPQYYEHSRDYEVGNLQPAEIPKAKQAEWMTHYVEAVSREHLDADYTTK
jgi:hypothetical protein